MKVALDCDLTEVPQTAVDAFRASADRLFAGALARVKELAETGSSRERWKL
jgi:hypothetical protein